MGTPGWKAGDRAGVGVGFGGVVSRLAHSCAVDAGQQLVHQHVRVALPVDLARERLREGRDRPLGEQAFKAIFWDGDGAGPDDRIARS